MGLEITRCAWILAGGLGLGLLGHNSWATGALPPLQSLPSIDESLCFIPGAGGGSPWVLNTVPRVVRERGVPIVAFDIGDGERVQWHAARFVALLEAEAIRHPNLRCHIVAYSMGGLVMRYAANHLTMHHPTLGEIPVHAMMLSMTTMSTPHLGTPLPGIFKRYFGDLDKSRMQMSEEEVAKFNDPTSVDFSPRLAAKPSFSYRTFIDSVDEAFSFPEHFGFTAIHDDFRRRNRPDGRNDGIVPYVSMSYGTVIGDIHAPHSFFNLDVGSVDGAPPEETPSLVEFFVGHWNYLHDDQTDRAQFAALGALMQLIIPNRF